VSCPLVSVMTSTKNAAHHQTILQSVLKGCLDPPDFGVNKLCFQVLRAVAKAWHTQGTGNGTHELKMESSLASYLLKDVTARSLAFAVAAHVNPNDGATAAVLAEIVELQRSCAQLYGAAYLKQLADMLTAALAGSGATMTAAAVAGVSVTDLQSYVTALPKAEVRALKDAFRTMICAKKGLAVQRATGKPAPPPQESKGRKGKGSAAASSTSSSSAGPFSAAAAAAPTAAYAPSFLLGKFPG